MSWDWGREDSFTLFGIPVPASVSLCFGQRDETGYHQDLLKANGAALAFKRAAVGFSRFENRIEVEPKDAMLALSTIAPTLMPGEIVIIYGHPRQDLGDLERSIRTAFGQWTWIFSG